MLSYEDCLALSDLTEEEIAAIAEHEHLPMIVAAELGCYLVHAPGGIARLQSMIADDIAAANARGNLRHYLQLRIVLHHFVEAHPGQRPGTRPAPGPPARSAA